MTLEFLDAYPVVRDHYSDQARDYLREVMLQDGRQFSVWWRMDMAEGGCLGKKVTEVIEFERVQCKRMAIALFQGESPTCKRYLDWWQEGSGPGGIGEGPVRHLVVTLGGVILSRTYSWNSSYVTSILKEVFGKDAFQCLVPSMDHEVPPPLEKWENQIHDQTANIKKAMGVIEKHFPNIFNPGAYGVSTAAVPRYSCKCCQSTRKPSTWYYCREYVKTVVHDMYARRGDRGDVLVKKASNRARRMLAKRLVAFTIAQWEGKDYSEMFQLKEAEVPVCARTAINKEDSWQNK